MYIEPNSDIIILKNIPLDNTYDHTIYFETKTAQHDWFYLYRKFEFNKYSYQRLNRKYIKVEKKADDLYDCNYMMYRNTAYGNKWFYAFIKTVEYVNDNVTQIEYEIDVMQTWHFDYELGDSFVIREHSASDNIGENLIPEDVPIGDYVIAQENDVIWKNSDPNSGQLGDYEWVIVAVSPFDMLGDSVPDGITATYQYSGLNYIVFVDDAQLSAETKFKTWMRIMNANGRLDTIFNIFYGFKEFLVDPDFSALGKPRATPNVIEKLIPQYTLKFKNDYNKPDTGTGADEPYYPHNNKLYTYPYNFLKLTDYRGNEVDYKYEYFSQTYSMGHGSAVGYKFILTGDVSPSPSVIATPDQYLKYEGLGQKRNYDYSFVLDRFPQCTWSGDAFTAWFAQTQYKTSGALLAMTLGQGLRGVANGLMGYLSGDSLPKSESGAPYIGNQINSVMAHLGAQAGEAVRRGTNVYGNESGSLAMAMNKFGIFACNVKIRKEYAKIIDKYFDRFGYKTMTTKVPNRHVRLAWTYTQTLGCVLSLSNLPADDAKKVCSIYDKGITFWDSYARIGEYDQTNTPISQQP